MRGEDEGARKLRVYALLEARYHFYVSFHAPRRSLEDPIRRRYYHVAPLPAAELASWRRLLSWAADQPTGHVCDPLEPRAEVLPSFTYERCLLPGASVRSLWKEYALFLEGKGAVENPRSGRWTLVLQPALERTQTPRYSTAFSRIHCTRTPRSHSSL
mmetsp:Transcript_31255/g.97906  ORF Transcript_31255/g.97906 Transcript_31255/m.97906 type:complete len:158 (+) Transcript_31255:791-1264(+)